MSDMKPAMFKSQRMAGLKHSHIQPNVNFMGAGKMLSSSSVEGR